MGTPTVAETPWQWLGVWQCVACVAWWMGWVAGVGSLAMASGAWQGKGGWVGRRYTPSTDRRGHKGAAHTEEGGWWCPP